MSNESSIEAEGNPAEVEPRVMETPGGFLILFLWLALVAGFVWLSATFIARTFWYPSVGKMWPFEGSGPLHFVPLADYAYALPVALVGYFCLRLCYLIRHAQDWMHYVIKFLLFMLVVIAAYATLAIVPRIYSYAKLILALGIATSFMRTMLPKQLSSRRFLGRSTFVLLLAAVIIAFSGQWWRYHSEQKELANLPNAKSDAPNILLITLDTVRAESLSLYGHSRPTSDYLVELGQNSIVFENAIATAPWTLPTHGSLFTGKLPHEIGAGYVTPMSPEHLTLAEILQGNGYATAGFAANVSYCGKRTGIDQGFAHYQAKSVWPTYFDERTIFGRILAREIVKRTFNVNQCSHTGFKLRDAAQLSDDAVKWIKRLKQNENDRPYFCFINYFDAHAPYLPKSYFANKFGELEIDDIELEQHEACVAYVDTQLRQLFAKLDKIKVLENTIVVITSDHGEQFGEHDLRLHGNSVYTQLVRVPLLIHYPRKLAESSSRVKTTVTLQDVPKTILDLADLDSSEVGGNSLKAVWEGTPTETPIISELHLAFRQTGIPNSKAPITSIVSENFHLIRFEEDQRVELYDIEADPREASNLADKAEFQSKVKELLEKLSEQVTSQAIEALTEE